MTVVSLCSIPLDYYIMSTKRVCNSMDDCEHYGHNYNGVSFSTEKGEDGMEMDGDIDSEKN